MPSKHSFSCESKTTLNHLKTHIFNTKNEQEEEEGEEEGEEEEERNERTCLIKIEEQTLRKLGAIYRDLQFQSDAGYEGLSNEMKIMKQQVFYALWSAYEKQQDCFLQQVITKNNVIVLNINDMLYSVSKTY